MIEPLKTRIYNYLDYRKFLADIFLEKKSREKTFTYRYLAEKVGLKSVGFITWILQGKRNLSERLVLRFSEALALNKQETTFFEILVRFNQARTNLEKKRYFDKLVSLNRPSAIITDAEQYEFYDKWYYSAIRELIGVIDFKGDFRLLANQLIPSITPTEARKAVELLLELGFIHKNSDGLYTRKDQTISTGQSWKSLAITNYQIQAFELGKKAVDAFNKSERELSTMTLSCSLTTFKSMQEKLKNLRFEFAEMAQADESADRVLQCNLQLFPLSKSMETTDPRAEK